MKKKILLLISFITITSFLFAESTSVNSGEDSDVKANNPNSIKTSTFISDSNPAFGNVQIAMSSADYEVTAGDIYNLSYSAGTVAINYPIFVDSTYKIRVSNLALLDVKGKTYLQVKKQVEDIVTRNYPLSGVQFILATPSVFSVTIKGSVEKTMMGNAWALSKLSTFVTQVITENSSIRNVTIRRSDGTEKVYDLFSAIYLGDLKNDPYLRPGDEITISSVEKYVVIDGAVQRPGKYELLDTENLKDLIHYANGTKKTVNPNRITLRRLYGGDNNSGVELYLPADVLEKDFKLQNGDRILLEDIFDYRNSIIVEGAINNVSITNDGIEEKFELTNTTTYNSTNRIIVKTLDNENYASFVRRIKVFFNSNSDLNKSYVERDGSRLSLDLEKYLNNYNIMSEYVIMPDDKLVILNHGLSHTILLKGEVQETKEIVADTGIRLSALIKENTTDYSSYRDIQVIGVDGKIILYDLFKAIRFGDMSQDPVVNAGEIVNIQRINRKVTLEGAVERPGEYQLLDGENLSTLVNYYGNGLIETADSSRIEITRIKSDSTLSGEKIYLNEVKDDDDFELFSYDVVYISTYADLKPVMFMEGAVGQLASSTSLNTSTNLPMQFENGTNYAYFIRRNSSLFKSSVSDNSNAYIIRGEEIIPIDINKVLYDAGFNTDLIVMANDILMVPFKQYFVTVAGAVRSPGRYPYIPDRSWEYYIGLAGGFIQIENSFDAVTITDVNGKRHSKNEPITPETRIVAKSNSFTYFVNQYGSLITSIATLITGVLTLFNLTRSLGK